MRSSPFSQREPLHEQDCGDIITQMRLSTSISRRHFCAISSGAITLSAFSRLTSPVAAPDELRADERETLSRIANEFMTDCAVPGLSVAVARHKDIIYQQAFGYADLKGKEPVTTASLFRIASVTKPITSTAIFQLVEQQKLSLDTKVFGADGVLGTVYGRPPYNPGIDQIKIEHLLTHTAGGWSKNRDDPMFRNPDLDQKELITATLKTRPLDFAPGTHYAYSNFGYCVLGRVIEKISGAKYADYVRDHIWKAVGIEGMLIAGNTAHKRAPEEVHYYDQEGGDPYGMNVTRLDSAGGWIATPAQILQFAIHVNGFPEDGNLLKPETIAAMTTGTNANPHYAKGWEVNDRGTWWHIGDLPGSSSILVRSPTGCCSAAFMNTRRMKPDLRLRLESMLREMVRTIAS